jgi:dTDP-glucose 4,6-dehydratase
MTKRPRAVVTGGAGFLGAHICERLLHDGYSVVCIDNLTTGTAQNIAQFDEVGPFKFVNADVTDHILLDGKVDAILHFASPASPATYRNIPIETLRTGANGTLHTLDMARDKGARYLLASTSEVYGDPQIHPQPETYVGHVDPIGERSCYDEAKRFAEAASMAYRSSGVSTAIVRIFNTYGPRMRPDDGRVVPTFVYQALQGEPIPVSGNGLQTRSLQYVDDCIEGCIRLLHSSHSGPVNIGNVQELSILALASLVRDLAGSDSEIVHVPRTAGDPQVRRPDISLAMELLDWAPVIELEQGLARTIDWFRRSLKPDTGKPPR